MISTSDKAAIDAWLAKNTPTKYPTGYSGIYDEFGRKRNGRRFMLEHLSKRIRRLLKRKSMSAEEIASTLCVPLCDVTDCVKKHNIEVKA